MTVHIVNLRGIGEPIRRGLIYQRLYDNFAWIKGVVVHDLEWAASYGIVPYIDGDSYMKSVNDACNMLTKYYDTALAPGDVMVVVGYSGGATAAGNWLASMDGAARAAGIECAALVADPMRPKGAGIPEYQAPGFGVGGQRFIKRGGVNNYPVWWFADPKDVITSCDENSPIRTVADQTFAVSFKPDQFPLWLGDLIQRVKTSNWQPVNIPWWDFWTVRNIYSKALSDLNGYLKGGDHTSYGVRKMPGMPRPATYVEVMLGKIAERVSPHVNA